MLILGLLAGACSPTEVSGPWMEPIQLSAQPFDGSEPPATEIIEVKGGGLALFDWQGDGDWDLFVPGLGSLSDAAVPAQLFENRAGELALVADTAGLAIDRWGQGLAVGDVDGDGLDDLCLACFGQDAVIRQTADQRLVLDEQALEGAETWSSSVALGDLDRDGDLDLAVVGYVQFDPESPPPATKFLGLHVFGGPAGMTPIADRVFENDGAGKFIDRTPPEMLAAARPGLGAAILDVNLDGSQDLWIGNDSQANQLWVQLGDWRFFDTADRTGLATNQDGSGQATMGLAIADLNGDLAPDLFSTNFARDTNTLLLSDSSGAHRDLSRPAGLAASSRPTCGWGTAFGDYNLDGVLDLVALNGHVYPQAVLTPLGELRAQPGLLYLGNPGGGLFPRFEEAQSTFQSPRIGRGLIQADLDSDGDLDLVTRSLDRGVELWRGQARGPQRIVEVRLRQLGSNSTAANTSDANSTAIGSRIECLLGDRHLDTQWITSSTSYQAGQPAAAWFSVPAEAAEVDFRVTWPDGESTAHSRSTDAGAVILERTRIHERTK